MLITHAGAFTALIRIFGVPFVTASAAPHTRSTQSFSLGFVPCFLAVDIIQTVRAKFTPIEKTETIGIPPAG